MNKFQLKDTYLQAILNSEGSKTFRNFYMDIDGARKDILENGALSCAFFVSNILLIFKLISSGHVTVSSTIKDMEANGWVKTEELREGAVIHWEATDFGDTGMHEHIGFYLGDGKAISNNTELGYPVIHSYDYEGKRKILGIYWNNNLN